MKQIPFTLMTKKKLEKKRVQTGNVQWTKVHLPVFASLTASWQDYNNTHYLPYVEERILQGKEGESGLLNPKTEVAIIWTIFPQPAIITAAKRQDWNSADFAWHLLKSSLLTKTLHIGYKSHTPSTSLYLSLPLSLSPKRKGSKGIQETGGWAAAAAAVD